MGTKTHNNYEDLITFTRASGGHALRPVSYGTELVDSFDSTSFPYETFTSSGNTITSAINTTSFGIASVDIAFETGKLYLVSGSVTLNSGTGPDVRLGINDSLGQTILSVDTSGSFSKTFVASNETHIGFRNEGGEATNFSATLSVKEVIFDQPDGTLTLFEHPDNVPRVEYDADGNRLGLLVERARTNLVQQSENFENVYWSGTSATPTINTVVSPTGQTDGTTVTATGSSYISKSNIITSQNTTITFSAFLKAGTVTTVGLHFAGNLGDGANDNCDFDLSNGTVSSEGSSSTATIEDVGNGWYRCSNTYTTNGTGSGLDLRITTSGAGTYYVFGAQAETASFKTSYIRTTGSTATRSADVASIPVADFGYNQSAGTLFVDFDMKYEESGSAFPRVVEIASESSIADRIKIQLTETTEVLAAQTYVNFNVQGTCGLGARTGGSIDSTKVAFAFREADFAASDNGDTAVTDTTGTFAPSVGRDTLAIGKQANASSNFLNGRIKSIKYYPRRLTDAQLQEITS